MAPKVQGVGLISGGKDGKIIVWAYSGGKISQENVLNLNQPEVRSMLPEVNAICHSQTGNILVGTRGGEILEFYPEQAKPKVQMRSHCKDELWGLAMNPRTNTEFITVGQDMLMAIWDIRTRKQKKFAKLECSSNAICYSSDGRFIAIGYTNGTLTVLNSDTFASYATRKDRKKEISEIKFNPDNSVCAVGAHDQMIITYDVNKKFAPMKKMRGHSSTILHLQFSLDG
jgi:WD40 repeat protein